METVPESVADGPCRAWPSTTISPTRGSRRRSSSRSRCGARCCSKGEAGVGKTEVAKVLAEWTGGELVRLQCYEGIDAGQAVYEWDYARQLLHLRALEASGTADRRGRAVLGAVPREAAAAARARPRAATPRPCC